MLKRMKAKTIQIYANTFGYFRLKKIKKNFPQVMNTTQTLNEIKKGKSLVRFGDGEFRLILGEGIFFQTANEILQEKLKNTLVSDDENIIVAIPEFNDKYNSSPNTNGKLSYWEWFWYEKFKKLKPLFSREKKYGQAACTRNTVFFENDITDIQEIWNNRDIVFVYGEKGRFNPKNEIFSNIKKYKEILISPTNAFDEYENILFRCLQEKKEALFLVSAGPTATVLCYELAKLGYQAIDIGHMCNSYDQYLGKISKPENLEIIRK
ncbi:MAG: GT-D fold domain-containing glycosyltransferase [Culicoidibacterales bacterium]